MPRWKPVQQGSGNRDVVRASMLDGVSTIIRKYGGDPDEIFAIFFKDDISHKNPDDLISCSAYLRLLEHCSSSLKCPFFGLEVSKLQAISVFGTLAILIHAATTVREALEYLVKFQTFHAPSASITLEDTGNGYIEFTTISRLPGLSHKRQAIEQGHGLIVKIITELLGAPFRPAYLRIAAAKPGNDLAPIREHFGCDLYYDQEISAIAIPADVMKHTLSTQNDFIAGLVNEHMEKIGIVDHLPVEEKVDKLIISMLPLGRCTLDMCAWQLGSSPRTLQMKLAERGLEFSTLLARRRALLAADYLRDTRMPISEIASALGYADQSSFTRAFASWTGGSPAAFRRGSAAA